MINTMSCCAYCQVVALNFFLMSCGPFNFSYILHYMDVCYEHYFSATLCQNLI